MVYQYYIVEWRKERFPFLHKWVQRVADFVNIRSLIYEQCRCREKLGLSDPLLVKTGDAILTLASELLD